MPLPSNTLSSGHHLFSAFDRTNLELGEACRVGCGSEKAEVACDL
jgi:hypothetical protein